MRLLAAIASLALLAGFTSACDMMVMPWKKAAIEEAANRPVTCASGSDCDEKWARALRWAKKNSPTGVDKKTDILIKTTKSPKLSPDVAFTITKTAIDENTYAITLDAYCNDIFGCVPPLLKLRAAFADYVLGTAPIPRKV